jgi:hypothetical protein
LCILSCSMDSTAPYILLCVLSGAGFVYTLYIWLEGSYTLYIWLEGSYPSVHLLQWLFYSGQISVFFFKWRNILLRGFLIFASMLEFRLKCHKILFKFFEKNRTIPSPQTSPSPVLGVRTTTGSWSCLLMWKNALNAEENHVV